MTNDTIAERPVVLITGGGTGIGAAIARVLAERYQVAICGRRAAPIDAVAAEIGGAAFVTDLGDAASAANLVPQVIARFGRLDALVLNAGVILPSAVAQMPLADWQAQIAINLTAPFILAQSALPHLIMRKGGIVAIASAAARGTGQGLAAYSASKAGLVLLTQTIAFENARHGLRANIISPGWVRTEMGDAEMMALSGSVEDGYAKVTRNIPERRAGLPIEIARVAAFLLSDAASYLNGAVIPVDGGGTIVDVGMLGFDAGDQ